MGMGASFMFSVVPVIVVVIFIFVIGTFIFSAVKGVSNWNKNNNSPILDVAAIIVAKRTDFRRSSSGGTNNMHHSTVRSKYFISFEFQSGDRQELEVDGSEYGVLVEGDKGILKFQGTRYLAFQRVLENEIAN